MLVRLSTPLKQQALVTPADDNNTTGDYSDPLIFTFWFDGQNTVPAVAQSGHRVLGFIFHVL